MTQKSQKSDNRKHKRNDMNKHQTTNGDKKTPPRYENLDGKPIE